MQFCSSTSITVRIAGKSFKLPLPESSQAASFTAFPRFLAKHCRVTESDLGFAAANAISPGPRGRAAPCPTGVLSQWLASVAGKRY